MTITVREGTIFYKLNSNMKLIPVNKTGATDEVLVKLYDSKLDSYMVDIFDDESGNYELFWIKEKDVEVI